MRREVRISFSDKLLGQAVKILLAEYGYGVTGDSEAPLITDDVRACVNGERALYIGREKPSAAVRYLHRPFPETELETAVNELLGSDENVPKSGIRIDRRRQTAHVDGERIALTDKELKLLSLLLQNRGSAVSDTEIVEKVFDGETADGSNIAAVYINYLRKKIDERVGKRIIYRVRGQGYMLK